MSKTRAGKHENKDQVVKIINHKFSRGNTLYEVEWKMLKQTTWIKPQLIPPHILAKYNNQEQSSYELSQKQEKKEPIDKSSKSQRQKDPNDSDEKQSSQKSRINTRLRSKGKKSVIEISSDTFFNEGQSFFKKSSIKDQSQIQKSQFDSSIQIITKQDMKMQEPLIQQEFIQVVAEAESSSSSSEDNQNQQQDSGGYGRIQMKQPKAKVSKGKAKRIKKKNKLLSRQINEDNMLINRQRDLQKKDYKEIDDLKMVSEKSKLNFQALQKQFNKVESVQSVLINSVLESGMCGPYKYYLVKLRNGENAYVSEKDMRHYFPRKLLDYYQRILNKVAKGTHQLNFAV